MTEREARHPPLVETSGLEDAPVGWPAAGELARALGAGGLILAIWAALGVLLATLLRSTALSIGLVYSLVLETVIFNPPIRNESFTNARDFFPGQNSSSLANSFSGQASTGFAPPPVDAPQAALVLLVYTAAFLALAALVFYRRDVE